jgi:general secretion pathway protein A
MFLEYFHLKEQPFGVTPDPRFLCLGPSHREAMASLLYGIHSGRGFMALIAEPGMGKTTLLFELLRSLGSSAKTVFLFQTQTSPDDFLRSILSDLGIEHRGANLVEMQSRLNEVMLKEAAAGRRVVVAIDEAQNLQEPVLELLRMLSNFETPREKLMQIILTGQPQLATKLSSPSLVQLRQRISIFGRLQPLTAPEINSYIDHRLRVAGYQSRTSLFTDRAKAMIVRYSRGIPRDINNICFNALSLACALKQKSIDMDVIEEVLHDLDLRPLQMQTALALTPPRDHIDGMRPVIVKPVPPRRSTWPLTFGAVSALIVLALPLILASQNQWSLPATWDFITASFSKRVYALPAATAPKAQESYSPAPAVDTNAVTSTQSDVLQALPLVLPANFTQLRIGASPEIFNRPALRHALATTGRPDIRSTRAAQNISVIPLSLNSANSANFSTLKTVETTSHYDGAAMPVSVQVAPNETLWKICARALGKCDPDLLQQIIAINPCITDPRFLRPGLWLVMPTVTRASGYFRGSLITKEASSR